MKETKLSKYRENLHYLPREEREAVREILHVNESVESVPEAIITRLNRSGSEGYKRV